jgi:hypothetical protein
MTDRTISCSERGFEPMTTDWKYKKKSSGNKFWNFPIWNKLDQTMVREIDATWNPIYGSILLMYKKLVDLGFECRDGKIVVGKSNGRDLT